MKVLLIGANGQLGSDLLRVFRTAGHAVVPATHAQMDVCSEDRVSEIMAEAKPDVVLNTAAFHKVEECEKNPALAFQVNCTAAMNLAKACRRSGAVLVHFSTDYVFDGQKNAPYEETDLPSPLNVYGVSKVAGEHLIACNADRYFVIRPTYTTDLAEATRRLILTGKFGLYHLSSEGRCSWYEFARSIFECAGVDAQPKAVKTGDFPSPVKRPSYSVLSKTRLRALGLTIPSWQDALSRYLQERSKKNPLASTAPVHASS